MKTQFAFDMRTRLEMMEGAQKLGATRPDEDAEILELRAMLAAPALAEALRGLLAVMNDRNAPGTHVDGRWMGVPDWEQVDAAAAALRAAGVNA